MKPGCVTFLASLALALPALVPATTGANAQVRKDVSEHAGRRCSAPPKGSGIILGQFSGVDDSPMVSMDGIVPVDRMRCFTNLSECKGWLYTMQSKYTNAGPATVARCIKR